MQQPIKLYRHPLSGHSHRVELFLSILHLDHELVDVDVPNGEHKRPPFLAMNEFGQIPVIDDNGVLVADSNAILVYLARTYDPSNQWLPSEPRALAEVQRFLTVVAGPIAFGPAAARLVNVFGANLDHQAAIDSSVAVLSQMDQILGTRSFLAGELSIADLAAYAYVAHAPEGDVSLEPYANVRAWLGRLVALPDFVPMQDTRVGLAA